MSNYKLSDGTRLQLNNKSLGQGGEGSIYEVISPTQHAQKKVAKIYSPKNATKERQKKIEYLIKNPPKTRDKNGHTFLIWPTDLVLDSQDKFAGFLMPKANGEDLELLCSSGALSLPEYKGSPWEKKFSFNNPSSKTRRQKVAYNLCAAIAAIHEKGNYVIGDLKPVNIKINEKGLISIIDLDSIQVVENGKVVFPSKVATPEYAPPDKDKTEYWDRFSLAVILYKLLVGIHPYAGTLKKYPDALPEDIMKKGYYPHGKDKDKFDVLNNEHRRLNTYSKNIQKLFKRAFENPYSPKDRPSAKEWCKALVAKPRILNFSAHRAFVFPNEPVQLNWTVENADKVTLNNGIGDVSTKSCLSTTIAKTTKFILTASNSFGSVTSHPVIVATFDLKVPKSIHVPTPNIHIAFHQRLSIPPSPTIKQPPQLILPSLNVSHNKFHTHNNLLGIVNEFKFIINDTQNSLLERLKNNYQWSKTLIESNNNSAKDLIKMLFLKLIFSIRRTLKTK